MGCIDFKVDDIYQILLGGKPILRQVSQDSHSDIRYAEENKIVEILLLHAHNAGILQTNLFKAV